MCTFIALSTENLACVPHMISCSRLHIRCIFLGEILQAFSSNLVQIASPGILEVVFTIPRLPAWDWHPAATAKYSCMEFTKPGNRKSNMTLPLNSSMSKENFWCRSAPSFHVRVAAGPACLAGILWSLGNYLSILAVASLGMAVGWPLVQCSLIVSNVWALFWYREVEGRKAIFWFLASSCIILCGVCLLAYFGL